MLCHTPCNCIVPYCFRLYNHIVYQTPCNCVVLSKTVVWWSCEVSSDCGLWVLWGVACCILSALQRSCEVFPAAFCQHCREAVRCSMLHSVSIAKKLWGVLCCILSALQRKNEVHDTAFYQRGKERARFEITWLFRQIIYIRGET